jgi:hypothetical protein
MPGVGDFFNRKIEKPLNFDALLTPHYFAFDHPWNPFIFIGILAGLLFLFWIWSSGLRGILAKKNYRILGVIQCVLFVGVLFLLGEPVWKQVVEEKTQGKLLVLFDASASTHLRKESPWNLVYQKNNPIAATCGGFEPDYFLFSEVLKRIDPKILEIPEMPPGTKIFHAIDSALRETSHTDERMLLLFSDGRDAILREQWDALKLSGIPVFTVGLGEVEDKSGVVQDAILQEVSVPETAVLFQTVSVKARIQVLGAVSGTLMLDLQMDGKNGARKKILLREGQKNYDTELEWQPTWTGETTLKCSIQKWERERETQNNQILKKIRVVSKSRQCLWVQGTLSWEFALVRKALSALTTFDVHSLILASASRWVANVAALSSGFPKVLSSYGAVVFLDCPLPMFSEERLKMLEKFVSERGGSLVFLGGAAFGDSKEIPPLLQKMLPFRVEESGMFFDAAEKKIRLHPHLKTREEWKHFSQKEFEEEKTLSGIWKGWKAKESAEVILEEKESASPVALGHAYGLGNVFFLGGAGTWLWKFDPQEESKKFYDNFWKAFFFEMMGAQSDLEDEALVLRVEDAVPIQGNAVRVQVLFGKNKMENRKEQFQLRLRNPKNQLLDLPFEMILENQAHASFVPNQSGEYVLEATLPEEKIKKELVLNVREDLREYEDLSRNDALLRRISQETGGQYATWKEYLAKPFQFHREESAHKKIREDTLWTSPWIFLFLLLVMSAGWILRRSIHLD